MRPTWDEYKMKADDRRPGAWPRMEFEARQTGRTTRMMADVLRLAAENPNTRVVVIVPAQDYGRELQREFRPPNNVEFCPLDAPRVAMYIDKLGRDDLGTIVRVDHSAVEHRFAPWLLELHRYDGQIEDADKFGNRVA